MVFTDFLNPVFAPLLGLDPLLAVGIVALVVSVLITVIYKYTTDQDLMKRLKTELKELQAEMKLLRDNPEKMMEVNKKAMESNMKYMSQSMKSTLYTLLPLFLIFGWMNANFSYESIQPGEQFSATLMFAKNTVGNATIALPPGIEAVGPMTQTIADAKATFQLKGQEGAYTEGKALTFDYNNKLYYKEVLITDGFAYAPKDEKISDSKLKLITLDYDKRRILPVLGWGWLGAYILFSIVFSMLIRKWMNVY
ncbi:MAG: EMC3/TMCO1 family protein [Nanoarchaeota archaeon]|nr:EMC3/TMCO1 family protein [Nanoarchaeota archaeon]